MAELTTPDEVRELIDKWLAYEQKGMSEDIGFDKIPRPLTDILLSTKLSSEATRFLLFLCRKTHTVNTYQGVFTRAEFSNDTGIERRPFNNLLNELDNGIFTTKAKQFDCTSKEVPFFHLEDLGKWAEEQGKAPVKHWQVTCLRSPFKDIPDIVRGWYIGTGEKKARPVKLPNPDDIIVAHRIVEVSKALKEKNRASCFRGISIFECYKRGHLHTETPALPYGVLRVEPDYNKNHHVYHFQARCVNRQQLIKISQVEACRRCKRETCIRQNSLIGNTENTDIKGK
jgi:hypothetical protein